MKKYKIMWGYIPMGSPPNPEDVMSTLVVEAESIDKVNSVQILPPAEAQKYAIDIKYCLRIAYDPPCLKDAKECWQDYGSWSKFIYITEVEDKK